MLQLPEHSSGQLHGALTVTDAEVLQASKRRQCCCKGIIACAIKQRAVLQPQLLQAGNLRSSAQQALKAIPGRSCTAAP